MYDYGYGYNTPDYNTTSSIAGEIAGAGAIFIIISLVLSVLMIISQWKIYKKAGKPGWASIVPIYNLIVLIEIAQLPIWYIALFFVPIANIYAIFKIYIELAHKFGKSTGFGVATVFFNVICLPILGFSKNCVYNGNNNNTQMNSSMQNQPSPNNNGMPNQNNFNNMPNNNMNNETQEPLFNQNINTEINQIQQEVNNNEMLNPQPQMNNNMQNPQEMNLGINLVEQNNTLENPTINTQTVTNEIKDVVTTVETMGTVNPTNANVQTMPTSNAVNEEAATFKYEPQSQTTEENVSEASTQVIPENQNIIQNENLQPVNPQPQINVIPNMGITPQPEMPNQNIINNQNNTNVQ